MSPADLAAIRALVELRRAGHLRGVWCDAGHLRVEMLDGHVFGARKPNRYQRVLFVVEQCLAARKVA